MPGLNGIETGLRIQDMDEDTKPYLVIVTDVTPAITGVLTPAETKTLSTQVGNFAFDAALGSLDGIASRLAIDLEGQS